MEFTGLLQALGVGLIALLSGCLMGFLGGALGGWISGYREPLLRVTDASREVRSGIAIEGAKFGSVIGLLAGAVSGVISASLAGFVSPLIPALVFGVLIWFLFSAGESVVGAPGGPVAGVVLGSFGGYQGRVFFLSQLAPMLSGAS